MDYISRGTELKYKVIISASGVDMNTDNFSVAIMCGGVVQEYTKNSEAFIYDAVAEDWYLCFDTTPFRAGQLIAYVKAYVPDSCFPFRQLLRGVSD